MRALAVLALLSTSGACHLVLGHDPRSPFDRGQTPERDLRVEPIPDLPSRDGAALDGLTECVQQVLTIETQDDDGEIEGATGKWYPTGETPPLPEAQGLYIGFWDNGPSWGYFRFRLPEPIPAGATLTSATLDLYGLYRTSMWDPLLDALQVSLEASADAAIVTGSAAAPDRSGGRPLVVVAGLSHLRWPPQGGLDWKVDLDNRSPELAPLFSELHLEKGELPVGAHLQLWLRGERTSGTAEVATTVFERGGQLARLNLVWCLPR